MALKRMSGLNDWPDIIREIAVTQFNGTLEVRKPGGNPTPDFINGTPPTDGTMGELIIPPRPARAQHIRLPLEINDSNGSQPWRRYRFQCEILPDDPSITEGMVVYFKGGRDPELEKMIFTVQWATNSSHAAIRTIETVTEGSRVNGL